MTKRRYLGAATLMPCARKPNMRQARRAISQLRWRSREGDAMWVIFDEPLLVYGADDKPRSDQHSATPDEELWRT